MINIQGSKTKAIFILENKKNLDVERVRLTGTSETKKFQYLPEFSEIKGQI